MDSEYKLRDCIQAHENDIKSVFALSDGYGFISASRDLSVRLWKDECDVFKLEKKYSFHKCYISVVIYMNPSMRYNDGIILSAGYDKIICGFCPLNNNLEFSLTGHTDTVTSLSIKGMELVSGSMDKTAIIWNLTTNKICSVLKGHTHGIWSVVFLQCIEQGLLTASADKDIFLWDIQTQTRIRKYSGHTDCVRNVLEIPEREQFLSCSNDATIMLWSLKNSACIKKFQGHSTYVYSMASIPDSERFVSCGEDGMVCLWDINNPSKPLQDIKHNAQSVWCVSALNNGDIITGASDGRIRLYSKHPNLQTGVELVATKSKDADNTAIIDTLPSVGIEMLSIPGDHDGQLLKVSDEGKTILYSWSTSKDIWVKQNLITNSTAAPNKKSDYVFSIDIKDGEPPLELLYNNGEDPWMVAHKFLEDNDLSPMFLEQVVNFITEKTCKTAGSAVASISFCDPFTGSNRYVPERSQQSIVLPKMFPQKSYVKFDQINIPGLSKKIIEFAGSQVVPNEILGLIEKIHSLSSQDSLSLYKWATDRISQWGTEVVFPLIDILRMLVRESACNEACFSSPDLVTKLLTRSLDMHERSSKGNVLTMTKLLVNAFCHAWGEQLSYTMATDLGTALTRSLSVHADKNVTNAVSSWLLNASVAINSRHAEDRRLDLLDVCFALLDTETVRACPESVNRLLVTVGSLVCKSDSFTFRDNLTMGMFERVNNLGKTFHEPSIWPKDVVQCCEQLAQLVSSLDLFNF